MEGTLRLQGGWGRSLVSSQQGLSWPLALSQLRLRLKATLLFAAPTAAPRRLRFW